MPRAWVIVLALSAGACGEGDGDPSPPRRDCAAVIWAQASQPGGLSSPSLEVVGSWDDWASPGAAMDARGDGWHALALALPAGEHGYLIVERGSARLDEYNPLTTFRLSDAREVSRLYIEDCGAPSLTVAVEELELDGADLSVTARFWAADSEPLEPLDPGSVSAEGLSIEGSEALGGTIALRGEQLSRGRHTFMIEASDEAGREAAARVSVFVDPIAPSWHDAILYQVMIDRFYADGGLALAPPPTPGSRAGGTLGGVEAALDSGYFEALGVSALWLSPVYQNPEGAREGTDGRLYEGYHGYWVEDSRAVDGRLGGADALRSLIDSAHARGVAVILDVVPNHVYETHEIVASGQAMGWFNEHPNECVCGTPSCPWSTFMQDCWFAPYLPDLRLEHPEVMNFAVDEILWWLDTYEVDGVRVDAVPMMPRAASRRIAHAVREHALPGRDRLVLGEVFTGSGPAGVAGLRPYLGPDGLDSVFDFPTMWALREVLASGDAGFTSLDALLDHIDAELAGSGVVLGRMLGNHDVERFMSAVVGDGGGDPWEQPASQPEGEGDSDTRALDRVALALTLQLTLPGMPVLYYGDELGLAGAGDPDNRRVMPELASLSPARLALLERARVLGQLRRCSPALRSRTRETLYAGADTYAYARVADDGAVVVVLVSRADEPRSVPIPGSALVNGRYRDVLGGGTLELGAGAEIELGARAAMVLIPEDDVCAH